MVNCRNLTSHSTLAISTNSELCSQVLGSRAARHENTLHAHLAPVIWPAQAPANHGGWLAGNHGGWLAPSELHAPMAYSFLHPQPTCLAMAPPRIIAAMTSAAMDSNRSAPRAAQSPTLSPTRSAITAGLLQAAHRRCRQQVNTQPASPLNPLPGRTLFQLSFHSGSTAARACGGAATWGAGEQGQVLSDRRCSRAAAVGLQAYRGSSSGMPASTFPTRSAPTSAALVKMPPPG